MAQHGFLGMSVVVALLAAGERDVVIGAGRWGGRPDVLRRRSSTVPCVSRRGRSLRQCL